MDQKTMQNTYNKDKNDKIKAKCKKKKRKNKKKNKTNAKNIKNASMINDSNEHKKSFLEIR